MKTNTTTKPKIRWEPNNGWIDGYTSESKMYNYTIRPPMFYLSARGGLAFNGPYELYDCQTNLIGKFDDLESTKAFAEERETNK